MTSVLQICFCFAITSRQHNLGESDQSYFKTYHWRAQLNNSILATFTKIRASFIGDEKCIAWQRGNNYGDWRYQCRTGWQLENDGLFSAGSLHLSLNSLHLCGLPDPRTWFGMPQVNIPSHSTSSYCKASSAKNESTRIYHTILTCYLWPSQFCCLHCAHPLYFMRQSAIFLNSAGSSESPPKLVTISVINDLHCMIWIPSSYYFYYFTLKKLFFYCDTD